MSDTISFPEMTLHAIKVWLDDKPPGSTVAESGSCRDCLVGRYLIEKTQGVADPDVKLTIIRLTSEPDPRIRPSLAIKILIRQFDALGEIGSRSKEECLEVLSKASAVVIVA